MAHGLLLIAGLFALLTVPNGLFLLVENPGTVGLNAYGDQLPAYNESNQPIHDLSITYERCPNDKTVLYPVHRHFPFSSRAGAFSGEGLTVRRSGQPFCRCSPAGAFWPEFRPCFFRYPPAKPALTGVPANTKTRTRIVRVFCVLLFLQPFFRRIALLQVLQDFFDVLILGSHFQALLHFFAHQRLDVAEVRILAVSTTPTIDSTSM